MKFNNISGHHLHTSDSAQSMAKNTCPITGSSTTSSEHLCLVELASHLTMIFQWVLSYDTSCLSELVKILLHDALQLLTQKYDIVTLHGRYNITDSIMSVASHFEVIHEL